MIAPTMPGHHGRSGHEFDKLPYSKTAARLAMQFQIGLGCRLIKAHPDSN